MSGNEMDNGCPVCGVPSDGLLCTGYDQSCTWRLEKALGDVRSVVEDLDIALSKQARIGTGGKGGLARERNPIHLGAMEASAALGNVLTTWARDVSGNKWSQSAGAIRIYRDPHSRHQGPLCLGYCWHDSCNQMETFDSVPVAPAAIQATAQLLSTVDVIRRHPAVAELLDEVIDAVEQARRAVDRPADRQYLGQCMSAFPDEDGQDVTCYAEIWARVDAHEVQCRVCGITHEVAERRDGLLERAGHLIVTVKQAAEYMGEVGGVTVNQKTIRTWIDRELLPLHPGPTAERHIRLSDLFAVVADKSEAKTRSAA